MAYERATDAHDLAGLVGTVDGTELGPASPTGGHAARSRMRFGQWTLTTDFAAGPLTHEAECTTCGEQSGAAESWDEPQLWCLRHAGRTAHTAFRATVMGFFRASLEEVL